MARPRSEQAHNAALEATVEVLLESGVEGVTLDEVAARSGVAKSTLYRHFGTKEALVAKAARCCVTELPTPDTGDLAEDLNFLFGRYEDADQNDRFPQMMTMLVDAASRDPQLQPIVDLVLEERRRPLRTIVQLAQLRGEVSPDLDLDVAIAMIVGPLTHWKMIERREVTPEFKRQILHGAIAALRATAHADAPVA